LNKKNSVEEITIIQGCILMESKSQELLYKKYFGYVMAISLNYISNRELAQEIVNDTFMKVFDSIDKFDMTKPFKGWLRRITINTAIDSLRKNKKFRDHLEIFDDASQTMSIESVDQLAIEDIHKIISNLPDLLRVVFVLYEIEGYTHKEISKRLNIPEGSSRAYLTKAKIRLRSLIVGS